MAMTEEERKAKRRERERKRCAAPEYVARRRERERKSCVNPERKAKKREWNAKYRAKPEIKAKYREADRKRRQSPENVAKYREYKLRKKYGLTTADVDALFVKQNGRCAICELPLATYGGMVDGWHSVVEHCHALEAAGEKRVRGAVHSSCNLLIGYWERLEERGVKNVGRRVDAYLARHRQRALQFDAEHAAKDEAAE